MRIEHVERNSSDGTRDFMRGRYELSSAGADMRHIARQPSRTMSAFSFLTTLNTVIWAFVGSGTRQSRLKSLEHLQNFPLQKGGEVVDPADYGAQEALNPRSRCLKVRADPTSRLAAATEGYMLTERTRRDVSSMVCFSLIRR